MELEGAGDEGDAVGCPGGGRGRREARVFARGAEVENGVNVVVRGEGGEVGGRCGFEAAGAEEDVFAQKPGGVSWGGFGGEDMGSAHGLPANLFMAAPTSRKLGMFSRAGGGDMWGGVDSGGNANLYRTSAPLQVDRALGRALENLYDAHDKGE